MKSESILITDIPSRIISGEVFGKGLSGKWRSHPYRSNECSGVMVCCGQNTNPEPLTIKLGMTGLFRIHFGIFKVFEGWETVIRVRLTNERCCTKISVPEKGQGSDTFIYETIWKDVELNGENLILEGEFGQAGSLASIRLEPIDSLPKKIKPEIAFPMAITEDGHWAFTARSHRRPEDLLEALESVPESSCMKVLLWCISGADLCNYPTQVGTYDYAPTQDHLSTGYRVRTENMRLWKTKNWDSMELVKNYAENRGWEFHVSMRMQAFAAHFPFDEEFHSQFFYDHPEWRCIDEKGEMIGRMSYAYPEVQEHILSVIKEILAYSPNGFNMIFTRGLPLVLYEPIMREGFKEKFGQDPLSLKENDERWLKYKADVVTDFVRKVKAHLKNKQRLSAILPSNKNQCAWGGLDVETWVKEGLVDDIYPTGYRYDKYDIHRSDQSMLDLNYFLKLEGRQKIRVFPTLFGCDESSRDLMRSHLEKGADGYCLWDGAHNEMFRALDNIGYSECPAEVDELKKYRKIPLERLGDFRIDRYHPWECF